MKGGHAWALRLLLAATALAVEASFIDEAAAAEAASGGSDSLRSALEAVNRRQRDLAALGGGVAGSSLTDYRLRPDAVGAPDLAFLAPPRDFAGDGQPENIGYGYQKSSAAGSGDGGSRAAERQLLEYLSGYLGETNGAGDKRSAFRERAGLRPPMTLRKRKPLSRSSSFRERTRGDLQALEALQARKREHGGADADELLRQAEAEAEQEQERQREEEEQEAAEEEAEELEEERRRRQEQQDEEEREAEYLQLLQALWRKYQAGDPDARREDELTPEDLQELLASAGDTGDIDKRQYGQYGGFDYFNNAGALGGWQAGGMYRKRGGRQRLEAGAPGGAGFLYALKFASPAAQREALEALAEEDAAEMGDERDEDAVRAAAAAAAVANAAGTGARRMTPIEWERAAEAEAAAEAAAEDAFGPAIPGGPDDYQRLYAEGPSARKRFAYDGALLAAQRKRYPVTKRSSDFYASPPLMHRRSSSPAQPSAFAQHDELRRKKDASNGVTDPKVASELNQIFGGDGSGDGSGGGALNEHRAHSSSSTTTTTTPESSSGGASPGAAPPTSPPATNGSRELTPEEQRSRNHNHNHHDDEDGGGDGADEEEEVPVAMSRVQGPPAGRLQVKKKSVDWSQYFGLDRRRKKAGSDDRDARWLVDRYRALALAAGAQKRVGGPPALDMRRFDDGGDIFARNSRQRSGGESPGGRLDGVDTKLLGMEDLIVNEAVKLTGAHQGTTDPAEVQQVKDRILARLAAAYSLEKMRLALREFKSSLQAQKMSRYNPENKQAEEDKKKRVAVKKEKAEEKDAEEEDETEVSAEDKEEEEEEKKKKKRVAMKKSAEEAEEVPEFLGSSRGIEPMSEGYMGHAQSNDVGECVALESLERECRAVGVAAGDLASAFLPLCTLHQICHICGPTVGAPSPGACDALFAREAALGCGDDPACALAARRTAALLPRRPPAPAASAAPEHCWPGSCLVQRFLAATLGARNLR